MSETKTETNPEVYPLVFKPLVKARVWGGRRLQEEFGREPLDPSVPCGESWEIVDLPGESCVVAAGSLQGVTLTALVKRHRQWLMGEAPLLNGRFPLLLKLLDARETLSVQVHPDEAAARRLGSSPKTEAWVVLDVQPGGCLYLGLREQTTPQAVRTACEDNSLEKLLCRVEVRPMDVIYIPAGTVHAIGGGLVLAEMQQASDTTYRLYDWGRMGLDGKPRPLHIEEAMESIDFEFKEDPPWRPRRKLGKVVESPAFIMEIVDLKDGEEYEVRVNCPVCAMCLVGAVTVSCGSKDVALQRGGVCLSPAAAAKIVFRGLSGGNNKILVSRPL